MYVAGEASVVAAGDSDRNKSISSALSHNRTRFSLLVLDPPELSRHYAHDADIVVNRQNCGIAPKMHENCRHDRFQYTMMLLVISAARFVHYMSDPFLVRFRTHFC